MSFDFHTFGWSNHILFFICSFIRGVVAVDVFPHIFYLYAMTIVFSEFIYWSSYRKICFNLLCLSLLSFVLEHICRFPNIDLIINLFFFDSNEFGSRSWFLPIEQLVFFTFSSDAGSSGMSGSSSMLNLSPDIGDMDHNSHDSSGLGGFYLLRKDSERRITLVHILTKDMEQVGQGYTC